MSQWPTDQEYRAIRLAAERALAATRAEDGGVRAGMGAVNWADLRVVDVHFCRDERGEVHWRILIEEASPESGLALAVSRKMAAENLGEFYEVVTEW